MAFTQNMLSDEEVLGYLGIDYADEMVNRNIAIMKEAAANFLNGAIGDKAQDDDARAKIIALAVIADMYDNRAYNDYSNKASASVRRLISDFSLQMVLESRGDGS